MDRKKSDIILEGLNNYREENISEEKKDIKFSDVSDFRVFKLDKDNACVTFKYGEKYHIQGVESGDKEVNLETDGDTLKEYIKRLKDAGFKEENVSKDDMQKQFDKISEDVILEKIGDKKALSKRESKVGKTEEWGTRRAGKVRYTHYADQDEISQDKAKIGKAIGKKMVKTAATGAIVKVAASKGILTGLIAAGVTGSKSVAGAALAVKVCTAIPMTGFGGLALAGVGVAAGAAIARKVAKKSIEKAESNVKSGYKTAWGKYYKLNGNEWEQISKEDYYKANPKNESYNLFGLNEESDEYGIDRLKSMKKESKKIKVGEKISKLLKDLGIKEGFIDEADRWITVKGTHVLVDDKGTIKNEKIRKKIEATGKNSGKDINNKNDEKSSSEKSTGVGGTAPLSNERKKAVLDYMRSIDDDFDKACGGKDKADSAIEATNIVLAANLSAEDISGGKLSKDDEKKLQNAIDGARDYFIPNALIQQVGAASMMSDNEDEVDNILNTFKDNMNIFNKHRKDIFDLVAKAGEDS